MVNLFLYFSLNSMFNFIYTDMKTVKISVADSTYLYWLLRTEAHNQKEDKKEIIEIAKLFKP